MRTKKIITWKQYDVYVKKLAGMIDKKFDTIICINRGGLVIGRLLSDILDIPLGVISAKCYEKGKDNIKNCSFQPLISLIGPVGKRVLLVDDLVDTAKTMTKLSNYLKKTYPDIILKTAVIFKDIQSKFIPDYFVADKKEWIIFPYEKTEFKNLK